MKLRVLHDNPDWYPPLAAAFDAEGLEHEQWLLGVGTLDLGAEPPPGLYWSRISASSAARGRPHAKEHARAVLSWLEAHGRRVVNGRRVLELEMSKAAQLAALRASGIEVPLTFAAVGRAEQLDAAGKLPTPFIVKPNQGGKGLGVRRFESVAEFAEYLDSSEYEPPVDGITLVQEHLRAAKPVITRVEIVGGELLYALTADTARGGFELCPAEACAVPSQSLFALRDGFDDHPIVGRYLRFAARQGIDVAGFEFIETEDGRVVTYDVNATTNYNPQVDAAAADAGPRRVARYLKGLLGAADEGNGS
ncbi:hypothetical protein [Actinospica sp.]|uniref:ATP-grasp domain-containing protein n=1 Tax=Actinospica sp. TaxID=1872142 RepID=UPI002CA885B4|nr:hypothetical protein [Actinospica sp.]HWG26979.1 hypothetical protein [Actinospica sp.]